MICIALDTRSRCNVPCAVSGSIPVTLGSLAAALVGAALLGRLLRVDGGLRLLIGVGTGICGASAIAAVSGVVDATRTQVAYAIATIFAMNVIGVITFPLLGRPPGGDPIFTTLTAIDAAGSRAVIAGSAAGPGLFARQDTGTLYTGRFALTVSKLQ